MGTMPGGILCERAVNSYPRNVRGNPTEEMVMVRRPEGVPVD